MLERLEELILSDCEDESTWTATALKHWRRTDKRMIAFAFLCYTLSLVLVDEQTSTY